MIIDADVSSGLSRGHSRILQADVSSCGCSKPIRCSRTCRFGQSGCFGVSMRSDPATRSVSDSSIFFSLVQANRSSADTYFSRIDNLIIQPQDYPLPNPDFPPTRSQNYRNTCQYPTSHIPVVIKFKLSSFRLVSHKYTSRRRNHDIVQRSVIIRLRSISRFMHQCIYISTTQNED